MYASLNIVDLHDKCFCIEMNMYESLIIVDLHDKCFCIEMNMYESLIIVGLNKWRMPFLATFCSATVFNSRNVNRFLYFPNHFILNRWPFFILHANIFFLYLQYIPTFKPFQANVEALDNS